MGRSLKRFDRNLRPGPVSNYAVAPHRYLYTGSDDSYRDAKDFKTFLAGVPYKAGEVVYVQDGAEARKAFVLDVWFERDSMGERRERYRIVTANKKGDSFSGSWTYAHPGGIQRGYKNAGLAPEMPADA